MTADMERPVRWYRPRSEVSNLGQVQQQMTQMGELRAALLPAWNMRAPGGPYGQLEVEEVAVAVVRAQITRPDGRLAPPDIRTRDALVTEMGETFEVIGRDWNESVGMLYLTLRQVGRSQ